MVPLNTHIIHIGLCCRQDQLQVAEEYYAQAARCFSIRESTTCRVCNRPFGDGPVMHYPNGVLCHPRCTDDPRRCPVTGKLF